MHGLAAARARNANTTRTPQILEAGGAVKELPGEAIELPLGQMVAGLGWSKDGQVGVGGKCWSGPPAGRETQYRLSGQAPVTTVAAPPAACLAPPRAPPQVLTVATAGGRLLSYLAALPAVCAAAGGRLAHLTSLSELAVVDCLPSGSGAPGRLGVALEPAFCAVGPEHVAAGLNNQARRARGGGTPPVRNAWAVALLDTHAALAHDTHPPRARRCCTTRTARTAPPRSCPAASTRAPCPACG